MRSTLVRIALTLLLLLVVSVAFGVYVLTRPEIDLTLRNVGEITALDLRIVGPGETVMVDAIEPGADVRASFDVEQDGDLHVLFTVEGQKRRVEASGYVTRNWYADLEVDLGPDQGAPHVVTVTPIEDR